MAPENWEGSSPQGNGVIKSQMIGAICRRIHADLLGMKTWVQYPE